MTQSKRYIVFQAYRNPEYLYEAAFSIHSVLKLSSAKNIEIVVYTDQPDFFKKQFPTITCEYLDKITLQNWLGPKQFEHRVKIELLKDFCDKYSGDVLYLDSDTYLVKDVQPLFEQIKNGKFIMHVNEGKIGDKPNPVIARTYNFVKNFDVNTSYGDKRIPAETEMWNAGVIGFNTNSKAIFQNVLQLTDLIIANFYAHIIEQLAFSYCLGKEGEIVPASSIVSHYWNFKEFRVILAEYFNKYGQKDFVFHQKYLANIPISDLMRPKTEYERLPSIYRAILKLLGKKWTLQTYKFDIKE